MTEAKAAPKLLKDEALSHLKSVGIDGMWPYEKDRQPALEPSCWAAIALRDDSQVRNNFLKRLQELQNKDGGWASTGRSSNWTTGLALCTLRVLEENINSSEPFKKGLAFLMENRADYYSIPGKVLLWLAYGAQYDYARGWPWTQNTFDWVEPTCYALMAIGDNPTQDGQVALAVQKAREFLLKTSLKNGWDFAARNPDDPVHVPYPFNTAQALLAIGDMRTRRTVRESLKFLQQSGPLHDTVLSLSWSAIALHAFGQDISAKLSKLKEHQRPDGSFATDNVATAMACIAVNLADQGNPFKLRDANAG